MPKLLAQKRKKVNFMVDEEIIERLEQLIPSGERSDFMNEAMNEKLKQFGRDKAFKFFEEFRKKQKKAWSTDEIVTFIQNEREKRYKRLI